MPSPRPARSRSPRSARTRAPRAPVERAQERQRRPVHEADRARMLPGELAQARLVGSRPGEHDRLIGRDAGVDHRLQPLVRHEARHPQEEVGRQRVEDRLIGRRRARLPACMNVRDVDGRVDHVGVAAPLVGDARGDEAAVRGDGDRLAGALAIERLEDARMPRARRGSRRGRRARAPRRSGPGCARRRASGRPGPARRSGRGGRRRGCCTGSSRPRARGGCATRTA